MLTFVTPTQQDLLTTNTILDIFGAATGLRTNMSKCTVVPICCSEEEVARVQEYLPCQITDFPITYLGIPLSTGRLRKEHLEPLVDKVRGRLPRWKTGLMNKAGRLAHVKATLTAIPIHTLMTIAQVKWMIDAIDKTRRGFFRAGGPAANGGQCMMAWPQITRPLEHGGLGIMDLQVAAQALHIRWLWLQKTDENRPWTGLDIECDDKVQAMFDASIQIILGDGRRVKFWSDRWLNGFSVQDIVPDLCQAVSTNTRRNRTTQQAMQQNQWIRDITGAITVLVLVQYFRVWELLQEVNLRPNQQDIFRWRWTSSGEYTAKSAYKRFFCGNTISAEAKLIWKSWAPPKAKLFMYLAAHRRTWTSERRKRHGMQDTDECTLCSQEPETIEHLLLHCPVARQVWWAALNVIQMPQCFQVNTLSMADEWSRLRTGLHKQQKKGVDTLFILVCWQLWKERNARVFRSKAATTQGLVQVIREEAIMWIRAGAMHLGSLIPRE